MKKTLTLAEAGRLGGKSKSPAKLKAVKKNLKLAQSARISKK